MKTQATELVQLTIIETLLNKATQQDDDQMIPEMMKITTKLQENAATEEQAELYKLIQTLITLLQLGGKQVGKEIEAIVEGRKIQLRNTILARV